MNLIFPYVFVTVFLNISGFHFNAGSLDGTGSSRRLLLMIDCSSEKNGKVFHFIQQNVPYFPKIHHFILSQV